ncbi:MAG: pilus assembly PilX N-terminal domain-containing protein [Candidatus Moraniibacteriota bacterium]
MKNIGFSKLIPKGSVLVFSLIILSLMLVTALTLLASSVSLEKSALSSGDSTKAFQVANTGNEKVLYQLYKIRPATIDLVATNSGATCNGGVITSSEGWTVRLFDTSDTRITDCAGDPGTIASIKSDGASQGTTRAVQIAVAAAATGGNLSCFSVSPFEFICCALQSNGAVKCRQTSDSSAGLIVSGDMVLQ